MHEFTIVNRLMAYYDGTCQRCYTLIDDSMDGVAGLVIFGYEAIYRTLRDSSTTVYSQPPTLILSINNELYVLMDNGFNFVAEKFDYNRASLVKLFNDLIDKL